jgi:hypothetical protein
MPRLIMILILFLVAAGIALAVFITTAIYEHVTRPTHRTEQILPACLAIGWGCTAGATVALVVMC